MRQAGRICIDLKPHCLKAMLAAVVLTLSACANMGSTTPASASSPKLSSERIAEILSSPDRSLADRTNDARRKPAQMLTFIGVRPGMVALDLSAGGGYTTELLARAVGPSGRVYGQSAPPKSNASPPAVAEGGTAAPGPARQPSPAALAERARNPAVSNIIPVVQKFEDPVPASVASGQLDLVTLMFNYHDLGHLGVNRAQMNKAVFAALKPGGMYVIADHAGRAGTGISESGTLHRIEQSFLRKEVAAAGFVLLEEAFFLRNPSDPRTKKDPDPPQPKDDFVLKFVKP